jgi:hypothetical protein
VFKRAFKLGVLKLACRIVAERESERELTRNIQNDKERHERFTAHHIPRSPMARAHRTVKRPEEINQRMKLPTKRQKGH